MIENMNQIEIPGFVVERDMVEKARRDFEALCTAESIGDVQQYRDSFLNFVFTAFHVVDWLKFAEPPRTIAMTGYLAQCRDICIAAKHRRIESRRQAPDMQLEESAGPVTWIAVDYKSGDPFPYIKVKQGSDNLRAGAWASLVLRQLEAELQTI